MNLTFPPLLRGEALKGGLDPFAKAVSQSALGIDPGLVVYSEDLSRLRAALVLAPEQPLEDALGALIAVQLGFCDALGALAPPEVAVHFVWPDRVKVNGAFCGHFVAEASTSVPTKEPDWLVIALDVPVLPEESTDPGQNPNQTCLFEEGCAEVETGQLIEAWSRHSLSWLNRFIAEGMEPLHGHWRSRCDTLGEAVTDPEPGTFMGLDEQGGMLLRPENGETKTIPLSTVLRNPAA